MHARETVSDVLLETLHALDVRYLFANLGTDYPSIVESLAKYQALGVPLPRMVLCPHENTAITAAHGAALATGRGQAVMVHVDVGTQNLGGALHNVCTGRIPMFIFAGRSPAGTRGERLGSRDNPIHYYQDVRDQAGIVRQYCKWELNLELPEQSAYAFQRAIRVMHAEPQGPIYMTAGREVLALPVAEMRSDPPQPADRPTLGELSDATARRIVRALDEAERPLVITSYAGRRPEAVPRLVALCERLGLPVVEASPTYLNFPRDHAQHWGFRAALPVQFADLVLLLDTDVPWIPKSGAPPPGTPVIQLDVDPLKSNMVMWDYPVTESHQVDTAQALSALLTHMEASPGLDAGRLELRKSWLERYRLAPERPARSHGGSLTPDVVSAVIGEVLGPNAVLIDETVSNLDSTRRFTARTRPGTYFGLPGGSLGWGGGAALGYRLVRPQADVAWLVGDGSFVFSVPSSLYMTAQHYGVPFLTVIYNNGGWNAVKLATDRMYGAEGQAARSGNYHHHIGATEHLEQVAAAFGCFAIAVDSLQGLHQALAEARAAMNAGNSAVINVLLASP